MNKHASARSGLDFQDTEYKELVVVFKIRCPQCFRFFECGWIEGVEPRHCPACKAWLNIIVQAKNNRLIIKAAVMEVGTDEKK